MPCIVELAGMPKSGKTSCIGHVGDYFRRRGFDVRVEAERAQICPHSAARRRDFAVWMAHQASSVILEACAQDRSDLLILQDRGVFDALAFLELLKLEGLIDAATAVRECRAQLELADRVDLVLLLLASPATTQARDIVYRHFHTDGFITNAKTLPLLAQAYGSTLAVYGSHFRRIVAVQTDDLSPVALLTTAVAEIKAALEHHEGSQIRSEGAASSDPGTQRSL